MEEIKQEFLINDIVQTDEITGSLVEGVIREFKGNGKVVIKVTEGKHFGENWEVTMDGLIIPPEFCVKLTMQQMCEHVIKANFLRKRGGGEVTAEEIFNSNLMDFYNLWAWYRMACKLIGPPQLVKSDG